MRTKAEIENNLKEWEDRLKKTVDNKVIISEHYENHRNNKINFYEGIINSLKWVLEEPTYKRTIYQLTDKEIEELVNIVDPGCGEIVKIKRIQTPAFNFVNIELKGITNEWSIYEDLDIHYHYNYTALDNQIKYADRIREMLSQEKPE